jgi:hypothetical protein
MRVQQTACWRSKKLFFLAGCILGEGPGWGARLFYVADSVQSALTFSQRILTASWEQAARQKNLLATKQVPAP